MESFEWQTDDGATIYASKWLVEEKPEAIIVMVHGLGEHIGRYKHVANFFNKHQIAFYGFDHRGHGKSSGKRGHIPGNNFVISDINKIIDIAKNENPDTPIFLYGHSMGGSMVLFYSLKSHPDVNGVICTSPGLGAGEPIPPPKLFLAKILKTLAPSMTLDNGLDVNNLSHNPQVIKDYKEDPLVHPMISARLAMDIFSNGDYVIENAAKWSIPLLLMVGTEDHIVSQEKIHLFVDKAPKNLLTFKEFSGLYHEIHNEYENEQVFNFIMEWIKLHTK